MKFIFILIVSLFFWFDLTLLKKTSPLLFKKYFRLPAGVWILYALLFLSFFYSSPPMKYLPSFVVILVMPVYLTKRMRFKKALRQVEEAGEQGPVDFKVTLALDAFGNVFIWFLGVFVFLILMETVRSLFNWNFSDLGRTMSLSMFSFLLMMVLISRTSRRYPGLPLSSVLALKRNNQSLKTLILWPALAGLVFAVISSYLLYFRSYHPVTPFEKLLSSSTSELVFFAFVAVAVLLAPLFEELIFRGYFYFVIAETRGPVFAFFFISLIFGGMHVDQYWGDWQAIVIVFLLGFTMTAFRARTGTTLTSIVMHYVYNFSMTIIPVILLIVNNPSYFEYVTRFPQWNTEEKETLLKKSITEQPQQSVAYNDLAWIYAEQGKNLDEALRLVEKALSLRPQEPAFWDTKAEILFKKGRIEEAIAIEQRLVRENREVNQFRRQLKKFQEALIPPPKKK